MGARALTFSSVPTTAGFDAEIVARAAAACFGDLKASVERMGAPDTPVPAAPALLADRPPRGVTAREYRPYGDRSPLLVLASVYDESGATWDLGASWLARAEIDDRLEAYADRGIFTAVPCPNDLRDALHRQATAFIELIRSRRRAEVVTVSEAVHGIAIANATIRSAEQSGAIIQVPRGT